MKMRKEMGEEKKKEKNRAEGSKAFIKKYFIKKKQLHSIKSSWRLLGFDWSCWVLDAPVGFWLKLWVQTME